MAVGTSTARITWGVLDQGLSSITNFALSALVAREVEPVEFGAFTIGFIAYTLVMGVSRSISMEPLLMRFSNKPKTWKSATRDATGSAVALGLAASCLAVAIGAASDGTFRTIFLALAVGLPGLILQDSWRFAFFAATRGRSAFLNDLIWALVLFPLLGLIIWKGASSVMFFTLAWGASASAAAVVGCAQAGFLPSPRAAMQWWRENWDIASRLLGEFVAMTGAAHLTLYAIGAVAGVSALGAIRGAQILLGPFSVLLIGIGLVAVPEGVRLLEESVSKLRRAAISLAAILAGSAMLLGGMLSLIPSEIGTEVLGATWYSARRVVLPIAFYMAFWGVSMGALIGLRVLGNFSYSLRARLIASSLSVSGALLGGLTGDALGAASGWAIGLALGSVAWWKAFNAACSDDVRQPSTGPSEEVARSDEPEVFREP